MIGFHSNYLFPMIGNSFVKEAYLGNNTLLKCENTELSSYDNDSRIIKTNYSEGNLSAYGEIKYNAVCTRMAGIQVNGINPGGVKNLYVVQLEPFTGESTLYTYTINCTSYNSGNDFTLTFRVLRGGGSHYTELVSSSIRMGYTTGFTFGDVLRYDFNSRNLIFTIPYRNGTSGAPSYTEYRINTEYDPFHIDFANVSSLTLPARSFVYIQD